MALTMTTRTNNISSDEHNNTTATSSSTSSAQATSSFDVQHHHHHQQSTEFVNPSSTKISTSNYAQTPTSSSKMISQATATVISNNNNIDNSDQILSSSSPLKEDEEEQSVVKTVVDGVNNNNNTDVQSSSSIMQNNDNDLTCSSRQPSRSSQAPNYDHQHQLHDDDQQQPLGRDPNQNNSNNLKPAADCDTFYLRLKQSISSVYQIVDFNRIKIVGEGYYSTAHLVAHNLTGTQFVMKLNSKYLEKRHQLEEIQLLNELSHKNILAFKGVCDDGDRLHALTEFCNHGSLENLILSTVPMDWQLRLSLALDIAKGMEYLHGKGYMHRDLTSSNVLLNKSNKLVKAVISDFGSAIKIKRKSDEILDDSEGNPFWKAPERLMEEKYDEKSDVFSYGIISLQIISRRDANPDDGFPRLANFGLDYIRFVKSFCPENIPRTFFTVSFKCCLMDPKKRPNFGKIVEDIKDSMVMSWSQQSALKDSESSSEEKSSTSDYSACRSSPNLHRSKSDAAFLSPTAAGFKTRIQRRTAPENNVEKAKAQEACEKAIQRKNDERKISVAQAKIVAESIAAEDPFYSYQPEITLSNPFANTKHRRSDRLHRRSHRRLDNSSSNHSSSASGSSGAVHRSTSRNRHKTTNGAINYAIVSATYSSLTDATHQLEQWRSGGQSEIVLPISAAVKSTTINISNKGQVDMSDGPTSKTSGCHNDTPPQNVREVSAMGAVVSELMSDTDAQGPPPPETGKGEVFIGKISSASAGTSGQTPIEPCANENHQRCSNRRVKFQHAHAVSGIDYSVIDRQESVESGFANGNLGSQRIRKCHSYPLMSRRSGENGTGRQLKFINHHMNTKFAGGRRGVAMIGDGGDEVVVVDGSSSDILKNVAENMRTNDEHFSSERRRNTMYPVLVTAKTTNDDDEVDPNHDDPIIVAQPSTSLTAANTLSNSSTTLSIISTTSNMSSSPSIVVAASEGNPIHQPNKSNSLGSLNSQHSSTTSASSSSSSQRPQSTSLNDYQCQDETETSIEALNRLSSSTNSQTNRINIDHDDGSILCNNPKNYATNPNITKQPTSIVVDEAFPNNSKNNNLTKPAPPKTPSWIENKNDGLTTTSLSSSTTNPTKQTHIRLKNSNTSLIQPELSSFTTTNDDKDHGGSFANRTTAVEGTNSSVETTNSSFSSCVGQKQIQRHSVSPSSSTSFRTSDKYHHSCHHPPTSNLSHSVSLPIHSPSSPNRHSSNNNNNNKKNNNNNSTRPKYNSLRRHPHQQQQQQQQKTFIGSPTSASSYATHHSDDKERPSLMCSTKQDGKCSIL